MITFLTVFLIKSFLEVRSCSGNISYTYTKNKQENQTGFAFWHDVVKPKYPNLGEAHQERDNYVLNT